MSIITDLCYITVGRVYHGEVCQKRSKVGYHPLHRTSLLEREEEGKSHTDFILQLIMAFLEPILISTRLFTNHAWVVPYDDQS